MRKFSFKSAFFRSVLIVGLVLFASAAPVGAFTISLSSGDFASVNTVFSDVRDFSIDIELDGDLEAGRVYDNSAVVSVQYNVAGSLAAGTPSNFPAFALNRTSSGEGPISGAEWISQGSSILFEVSQTANILDGLQISDLVVGAHDNVLIIDAREFERADVSRFHAPFLALRANGSLLLKNSNNSSGDSGTVNPQTGDSVDLDFRDEYVTTFRNNISTPSVTIVPTVVPEPGTALLLGLGLLGLASAKRKD